MTKISLQDWQKIPRKHSPTPLPKGGIGLCLSGGGFKASLYHIGSLTRLNEIGILSQINLISSVSGGAIVTGLLAKVWEKLKVDMVDNRFCSAKFKNLFVNPLYEMITKNWVGPEALLRSFVSSKSSVEELSKSYSHYMYGKMSLQDLPNSHDLECPEFTFVSTCIKTGAPWYISQDKARCQSIGQIARPKFLLSDVIAASSAHSHVFSPMRLDLTQEDWVPSRAAPFSSEAFRQTALLGDGAFVDNQGLEPVLESCKTVLISDAGSPFDISGKPRLGYFKTIKRVRAAQLHHDEVSRTQKLQDLAYRGEYNVLSWRLGDNPTAFSQRNTPHLILEDAYRLLHVKMGLNKYNQTDAQALINHGYSLCGLVFENDGPNYGFEYLGQVNLPFT